MEANQTRLNVKRLQSAVESEINSLDRMNFEYSAWDDSYDFINNHNQKFIEKNLVDETFTNVKANFILFVNNKKEIVWGKGYNFVRKTFLNIPNELIKHLNKDCLFPVNNDTTNGVNGLLVIDNKPAIVSSRPIVTSDNNGPIRGRLIMGRFITENFISGISENIHLKVILSNYNKNKVLLTDTGKIFIQPLSDTKIKAGYIGEDIYKHPAVIWTIETPREFYNQAKADFKVYLYTMLLISLFFGLALIFIIERSILSRILTFHREIKKIRQKGDLSLRISELGNDEISALQKEANFLINELRKTQNELSNSEKHYRLIVEDQSEIICRFDLEFKITFVNKAFANYFALQPEILVGKNFISVISSDGEKKKDIEDYIRTLDNLPRVIVYEQKSFNSKNEIRWQEWTTRTIISELGSIVEYQAVGRDITDRKKAEEALIESRSRNMALLKAIPDFVFRFRKDRTLLDFHIPSIDSMQSSTEKFLNVIIKEIFSDEMYSKINDAIENESRTGEVQVFDFQIKEGDEIYYEEVRIVAAENDEYMAIVRDVTDTRHGEMEVQRYIEELQYNEELITKNAELLQDLYGKLCESEAKLIELNNKKDKFFSIISHDLRSPFNALIGFTSLLADETEKLTPIEIREYSVNANDSALSILKLLENLLYWSRLQMDRLEFKPENLTFKTVIHEVLEPIKPSLMQKNIQLDVCINYDCVYADKFMLETIMRNLISNAIKFCNRNGKILIESNYQNDGCELIVSDDGIGIPDENLSKLFMIDEKIITNGTEKEKGTGLGLILCKEFIEKHNGSIKVESSKGKGTKFIVFFPEENSDEIVSLDNDNFEM